MKVQATHRWAMPIAVLLCFFSNLAAQEGKISGYLFGDYFYEFSHPNAATDALNRNGFQFRRAYFTYDRNLSERFFVRFRLEMNSPDIFSSQDFGASSQLTPYIKHAFLRWNNFISQSNLSFGLVPVPTWSISEEVWGYRAVEKTIMDLRRVTSSADFGLGLEGKFTKSGVMNYSVLIANGTGTRSETDKNKRVFVNTPIKIQNAYFIVPYFDYEGGDAGRSKNTLALFAGLQKPNFHGGVEAYRRTSNKALANKQDRTENGFSIFGAVKVAEKVKLLGRYDLYDPNADLDDDGNTFIIAGLDFAPEKNVNIIPNVKIESYQAAGRDATAIGEVTLFFRF
ncbi:MAG: hypothetical protein ONB46_19805 [candidate division KSB1 bacterium]|nr:hypothetical protein [candidate division KSB1 bacterium]MDZ7368123.1 hypothetical protein [candidate division KSB1 bacterium]MDZ7405802.1 hypothetical protein [candidate division KSB1 bacterium]